MQSRLIKFRVWDFYQKKFILDIEPGPVRGFNTKTGNFCYQQYTGLQDKNGRDIYEGDILTFMRFKTQIYWFDGFIMSLKTLTDARFGYPKLSFGLAKSEAILGNIFENPELLEECIYIK